MKCMINCVNTNLVFWIFCLEISYGKYRFFFKFFHLFFFFCSQHLKRILIAQMNKTYFLASHFFFDFSYRTPRWFFSLVCICLCVHYVYIPSSVSIFSCMFLCCMWDLIYPPKKGDKNKKYWGGYVLCFLPWYALV